MNALDRFPRGPRCLAATIILTASWALAGESRDQWQQPDRVMADLAIKPGMVVADVGCGGGYFTFRLAQAVGPQGKVYAADPADKPLQGVRERAQKQKLSQVEVIHSEPTNTKVPNESCDAAVLICVVHEAQPKNQPGLFQDLARALKPGGMLYVIDWRKSRDVPYDSFDQKLSQEQLVKLGTDAGLKLDAEFHYLKWQVFLRFRKPCDH